MSFPDVPVSGKRDRWFSFCPSEELTTAHYRSDIMWENLFLQSGGGLFQGLNIGGILRDLGIFAIAAGLFAFIAREAIKNYFDKELQAFQSELDKESVIFSELHDTRAEIVSEFYAKMCEFDEDMRNLADLMELAGEPSKEDYMDQAADSGEEFRQYYKKNKIYFPPHICDTMEELLSEYQDIFHDFSVRRVHETDTPTPGSEDGVEDWLEDWETLTKNKIPELREELENHFRDLLGVETGDSGSNNQNGDGDS